MSNRLGRIMIPRDKILHAAIGNAAFWHVATATNTLSGAIAVIGLGAGIEIYQKITKKGTPDWLDFAATIAGGAAGMVQLTLIN